MLKYYIKNIHYTADTSPTVHLKLHQALEDEVSLVHFGDPTPTQRWGFPGARPGSHVFLARCSSAEEAAAVSVATLNRHKCVCCRQNERQLPKQSCSYETATLLGRKTLCLPGGPKTAGFPWHKLQYAELWAGGDVYWYDIWWKRKTVQCVCLKIRQNSYWSRWAASSPCLLSSALFTFEFVPVHHQQMLSIKACISFPQFHFWVYFTFTASDQLKRKPVWSDNPAFCVFSSSLEQLLSIRIILEW